MRVIVEKVLWRLWKCAFIATTSRVDNLYEQFMNFCCQCQEKSYIKNIVGCVYNKRKVPTKAIVMKLIRRITNL
jgi:hypothetical protein